jgi:hypothetical protein
LHAIEHTISVPARHSSLAAFLKFIFGTGAPTEQTIEFWGKKAIKYLEYFVEYHKTFYRLLLRKAGPRSWQNLSDEQRLSVQKAAIAEFEMRFPPFDRVRGNSFFDAEPGTPAYAQILETVGIAERLRVDPAIAEAHRDMLADHLAYLRDNHFTPGARFMEYVKFLAR